MFDVTEDCPAGSGHARVLLQYGKDGQDAMIQISVFGRRIDDTMIEEWRCHFHLIPEIQGFELEGPDAFPVVAGGLHMTADDLYLLIMVHLPISVVHVPEATETCVGCGARIPAGSFHPCCSG